MTDEVKKEYQYNPFMPQPEDYFQGYNESIKKNFNPKYLRFAELTHRLFSSGDGLEWLELVKKDMMYTFAEPTQLNYAMHMAAVEGVRKHLFNIEQMVEAHKKHLLSA